MRSFLGAFLLATSLMLVAAKTPKGYMDTLYQWKFIDYEWISEARRQQAVDSGAYNFSNILPVDVDKAKDGRVFISILGRPGVPATLGTVSDTVGPSGPLIKPYPDWSYFEKGNCDSLSSVYRMQIDECNRLWVLDTGALDDGTILCEAQLLAFDLATDKLIKRVKIPDSVARNKEGDGLLVTPIVETHGYQCEQTTVYMADTSGNGLVVWNGERLVRLENPVFKPDPKAVNVTILNNTIPLNSGIVTMDLSPEVMPGEERFLYFHSIASFDIYAASSEVLKRSTYGESIQFLGGKDVMSSQAIGTAFSSMGTLFLGLTGDQAIACWNKFRPLKKHNVEIVAQDAVTMQFHSGMKVLKSQNGYQRDEEEVWAFSNRFVKFRANELDFNEYNFFVLTSPVQRLIKGTVCELPKQTQNALNQLKKQGTAGTDDTDGGFVFGA